MNSSWHREKKIYHTLGKTKYPFYETRGVFQLPLEWSGGRRPEELWSVERVTLDLYPWMHLADLQC